MFIWFQHRTFCRCFAVHLLTALVFINYWLLRWLDGTAMNQKSFPFLITVLPLVLEKPVVFLPPFYLNWSLCHYVSHSFRLSSRSLLSRHKRFARSCSTGSKSSESTWGKKPRSNYQPLSSVLRHFVRITQDTVTHPRDCSKFLGVCFWVALPNCRPWHIAFFWTEDFRHRSASVLRYISPEFILNC